jgi:hypothetical protein
MTVSQFLMNILFDLDPIAKSLENGLAEYGSGPCTTCDPPLNTTEAWMGTQLTWAIRRYYGTTPFLRLVGLSQTLPASLRRINDLLRSLVSTSVLSPTAQMHRDCALAIVLQLMLVSIPFACLYYWLSAQGDSIVRVFSALPRSAVRDVLQRQQAASGGRISTSSDVGDADEEDEDPSAVLQTVAGNGGRKIKMIFLFLLSLAISLAGAAVLYFRYLTAADEGARVLDGLINVYFVPAPLMFSAMQTSNRPTLPRSPQISLPLHRRRHPYSPIEPPRLWRRRPKRRLCLRVRIARHRSPHPTGGFPQTAPGRRPRPPPRRRRQPPPPHRYALRALFGGFS